MTPYRTGQLLHITAAICLAAATIVVGWMISSMLNWTEDRVDPTTAANKIADSRGQTIGIIPKSLPSSPAGDEQAAITRIDPSKPAWSIPLRRPLYDPPPAVAISPPPIAPPNPPPLKWIGAMIEPGRPAALLMTSGGRIELVMVGHSLEGARVLEIHERSVKLDYQGRIVEIKAPEASSAMDRLEVRK